MFPPLLRKPASHFVWGVGGMEIPVPAASQYLKILRRSIGPESDGPQMFPALPAWA